MSPGMDKQGLFPSHEEFPEPSSKWLGPQRAEPISNSRYSFLISAASSPLPAPLVPPFLSPPPLLY